MTASCEKRDIEVMASPQTLLKNPKIRYRYIFREAAAASL